MARKILGVGYYPIVNVDSFQFVESIQLDAEGNWKLTLTKDAVNAKVFDDEIAWVYKGLNDDTYYCESDELDIRFKENTHVLLILDQV